MSESLGFFSKRYGAILTNAGWNEVSKALEDKRGMPLGEPAQLSDKWKKLSEERQ